jgi:hypothetical protein
MVEIKLVSYDNLISIPIRYDSQYFGRGRIIQVVRFRQYDLANRVFVLPSDVHRCVD